MQPAQRHLRKNSVVCVIVALVVTLITGWYPKNGGGPGSSNAKYGVPFCWRIMKWRAAIEPIDGLVRLKDGRVEEKQPRFHGAGTTHTRFSPFRFALDAAFWFTVFTTIAHLIHTQHARKSTADG